MTISRNLSIFADTVATSGNAVTSVTIPALIGSTTLSLKTGATTAVLIDASQNVQVGGTTVANTAGYVNSRTNARAWVNFNGTLTTPITPRANYNASSVTKNASGDFTINFTVALADANYACGWSSLGPAANLPNLSTIVSQTTSAVRVTFLTYNAGSYNDPTIVSVIVFGN